MASIVLAFGAVSSILDTLNDPILKETVLPIPYVNQLKRSVTTIKSVILDAVDKDDLSKAYIVYINKLKEVVYDADDLFDEIVTQSQKEQLSKDDNNNIPDEVCQSSGPTLKVPPRIREIRSRLERIASDRARFGLSVETKPNEITPSNDAFAPIPIIGVVGRNGDAEKVIGMLLESMKRFRFDYCVSIVGVKGVGKTTLAKFVFDDHRITDEFVIRLWVPVSDRDGVRLDLKRILLNILASLECQLDDSSSIEFLQLEYKRKLSGQNFLMVLDDIGCENIIELRNLKDLLMIAGTTNKCRIIATTQSMNVARILGDDVHELEGLSNDDSRHLFEEVVSRSRSRILYGYFEDDGEIVNLCSNIPLVAKMVGRLLCRQPKGTSWKYCTSEFAELVKEDRELMSTLKSITYNCLEPSLKSCFAYCAIFPKDYVIRKETLMNLWEANGYILPLRVGQSIESAGEEHFSILLQRGVFKDIKKDMSGDVWSFKIHDLMHVLAQTVSGNEIQRVVTSCMPDLYSFRHLSVHPSTYSPRIDDDGSSQSDEDDYNNKSKLRSFLSLSGNESFTKRDMDLFKMSMNLGCLRALAIKSVHLGNMCDTIGNLLHLRYLDLSNSDMSALPDSIVNLHNLRILNINGCEYLKEWPKEFSKLVNLTHLYFHNCFRLSCMPVGLSKLSHIRRLSKFLVEDESASGKQRVGQLIDLKSLSMNLKGLLVIDLQRNFKGTEGYEWSGSCLEDAEHLTRLYIRFGFGAPSDRDEVVMDRLKPHSNLRELWLRDYSGEKIAGWGRRQDNWAMSLPNLVHINLYYCDFLKELPGSLSKLQHLKSLSLRYLLSLEYMEEEAKCSGGGSGSSSDTIFFPSLESLELEWLSSLKRWWKSGDSNDDNHQQPVFWFPNLIQLKIHGCPRLTSFPACLNVPELYLSDNNEELRIKTADDEEHTWHGRIQKYYSGLKVLIDLLRQW